MRKTLIPILLIFSVIINIVVIYVFVLKGKTYKDNSGRIAVKMTKNNRDFVLKEMREFLESVQQINDGIINKDPKKIISAGKNSGGSVIEHAPKGLLASLPVSFKKLGFATHDIFDEIKDSAMVNFNPKVTHKQLQKLLNNCVACHKSYKIETSFVKKE